MKFLRQFWEAIFVFMCLTLIVSVLLNTDKTEIVKKEVVKHERHKNVLHDDGKTTEVFSHTIRYGDTMTVEIDTFIYR